MEHTPASPTLNSVLTGILSLSTVLMFPTMAYAAKEIGGRTFLTVGETYRPESSSVIYGASGSETVLLQNKISATLDGNVERLELPQALANYRFAIQGTEIEMSDSEGVIVTLKGLNQPMTIAFTNGSALLSLTGFNSAALGSADLSSLPTALNPALNTSDQSSQGTPTGTKPDFTVQNHTDTGFTQFNHKVVVFDIPVYASSSVASDKLLHAANVLAQYLDNDENGEVDNALIWESMKRENSYLMVWTTERELENFDPPENSNGQGLRSQETHPEWHKNGKTGEFDATIEEVWHLVTHNGYSSVYSSIFGEQVGSSLAQAMDTARGGQFTRVPNQYPEGAWYTYDDQTCDYSCMITEYFYWGMTSLLGAQANRFEEISQEWQPNTASKLKSMDQPLYQLLTNPQYLLPTVLPDGSYGS